MAAALAGALVQAAPAGGDVRLRVIEVMRGLPGATHVAFAPGEPRRLYVVQRDGIVRVRIKGKLRPRPFLDIRELVSAGGERGLFSIAFHPDYAKNRLFYVDYTDRNGDTRLVEYRSNGRWALPGTRRVILAVEQPFANHNGGQLAFGADELLYVGKGDGGSQGDPGNRAQNLHTPLGKILRLDPAARPVQPELVAYGVRNPWRFSFDRATGDLWVGDVGGSRREEVDVLPAGTPAPVNLGWNVYEGSLHVRELSPNPAGPLLFPVHEYGHDGGHCSITGGFVYRGSLVPAARGRYFFGDYCSGAVWSLRLDAAGRATDVRREAFTVPGLTSFGEGTRGELYLASLDGSVYRLATR